MEPGTNTLICRHAAGPGSDVVREWQLQAGTGIVGWVVSHGQPLNTPDTRAEPHHFKEVDRVTGIELRSILSVPLQIRQQVIGVLQIGDTQVGRFDSDDLELLQSLAATAAIAIENARLYEQARRDAAAKAVLLDEVNHRVKNNLTSIIGLLYAEQRFFQSNEDTLRPYGDMLSELSRRIEGLIEVHQMLSSAEWAPLPLDQVADRVIGAVVQAAPRDKRIEVDIAPSSVRVSPRQANHLALIINELATNTVKYGLTGRDAIHITIHLEQTDDVVHLEFRDDGPGYTDDALGAKSSGIGTYLITTMVTHSLRGEVDFSTDGGAVVHIRFPADKNGTPEGKKR
jgi:two-component sensor histidine kinase